MLHLLLAEEMKLYMTTIASPGPSTAVDATIATATNAMRCRECLMRRRAHPTTARVLMVRGYRATLVLEE